MKLHMTELDTKETKPKMSEYNEKKYIILNEFSEKNIDDLYLKIRTEHGHRTDTLSFGDLEIINGNSPQHNRNKIIQFVKENPSNYVWKSLETNEYLYLVKDYYRIKKLEVILSSLVVNDCYSNYIYYFDLSYLKNMIKTDKIISAMVEDYKENQMKNMETKLKDLLHKTINEEEVKFTYLINKSKEEQESKINKMKSFNELEFYKITIKLNFMNDRLELNNKKNNILIIIIFILIIISKFM